MLAVYGSVRNLTDHDLTSIVLELRTESEGKPLGFHTIRIRNVPAQGSKAFREDIIRTGRTGKEEMGYLEVKKVEEAPSE